MTRVRKESDFGGSASSVTVATVPYMNARPLTHGLDDRAGWRMTSLRPSELAAWLDDRCGDVAMVPAVDTFDRQSVWRQAAPYGIAADGPVWTVGIFLNAAIVGGVDRAMDSVRRLRIDGASHSSVALAKVIFAEWFGRSIVCVDEGDVSEVDAELMIGDRAWRTRVTGRPMIDLAEVWRARTGLPMVFALWMARRDAGDATWAEHVRQTLSDVAEKNLADVDAISVRYASEHGFDEASARDYFGRIIRYRLGRRECEGLALFEQLWRKHVGGATVCESMTTSDVLRRCASAMREPR